jgi:short-subunit dehydrogenase
MLTSHEGFPPSSAYVCLKFALEGFSESMAHELEQFKIKVLLIEPWVIKTYLEES